MKILGILNITEDSFSDGGKYLAPGAALASPPTSIKSVCAVGITAPLSRANKPAAMPIGPAPTTNARAPVVIPARLTA